MFGTWERQMPPKPREHERLAHDGEDEYHNVRDNDEPQHPGVLGRALCPRLLDCQGGPESEHAPGQARKYRRAVCAVEKHKAETQQYRGIQTDNYDRKPSHAAAQLSGAFAGFLRTGGLLFQAASQLIVVRGAMQRLHRVKKFLQSDLAAELPKQGKLRQDQAAAELGGPAVQVFPRWCGYICTSALRLPIELGNVPHQGSNVGEAIPESLIVVYRCGVGFQPLRCR